MRPLSTILRMLLMVLPLAPGSAAPTEGDLAGASLARLGPQARALVERAFAELPAGVPLVDVHAHLVGLGTDDSGLWVNPGRLSPRHPGHRANNFDLFLRLLAEPRYQGLLFGDISALTQFNRMPKPMLELLRRPDLQARLVQGSDYPLPAVDVLVWTRQMLHHGLITRSERRALNEIFKVNPLLFDVVLKRTLRDPSTGRTLLPEIFLGTALTARPESAGPGR